MPSGQKYERHQLAIKSLTANCPGYIFGGDYNSYCIKYGQNSKYKNSDFILIDPYNHIHSYEIKCHKNGSDWGEISWDQANRLLTFENMIILEYEAHRFKQFSGIEFIKKFCYFTKNGRIHYNYMKNNKRVNSHPVNLKKLKEAWDFFK